MKDGQAEMILALYESGMDVHEISRDTGIRVLDVATIVKHRDSLMDLLSGVPLLEVCENHGLSPSALYSVINRAGYCQVPVYVKKSVADRVAHKMLDCACRENEN